MILGSKEIPHFHFSLTSLCKRCGDRRCTSGSGEDLDDPNQVLPKFMPWAHSNA